MLQQNKATVLSSVYLCHANLDLLSNYFAGTLEGIFAIESITSLKISSNLKLVDGNWDQRPHGGKGGGVCSAPLDPIAVIMV